MEKVLVIGPFNKLMKQALEDAFGGFELEYITERAEYGRLADADYVILRTLRLDADDIAAMKNVRLIQRWGVGFDTVDIEAAAKSGIPVAVTYGINAQPVAEMSVALALAVCRNIVPMSEGIKAGRWDREQFAKTSFTINGKTVGVIGMGNVGRRAAAIYSAFGAKIIYYDAFRLSAEQETALGVTYSELTDIWPVCDIITLHAPAMSATEHMVNSETLAMMKPTAVLINTAREELVDMPALASALKEGRLLGAGLDAVEESTMSERPFEGLDNVVISAHLGGNTADNAVHMAQRCAEQISAVSRGEKLLPPHIVNAQMMQS